MQGVHSIRMWPCLIVDGKFEPLQCDFWKVLSINSTCSHGSQKSLSCSEKLAQHSTRSLVEDTVCKNIDHFVKIWAKAKAFDPKLVTLFMLLAVVSASETGQWSIYFGARNPMRCLNNFSLLFIFSVGRRQSKRTFYWDNLWFLAHMAFSHLFWHKLEKPHRWVPISSGFQCVLSFFP